MKEMGKEAKKASLVIAHASAESKNKLLNALADALEKETAHIEQINQGDYDTAQKAGMEPFLLDRLSLKGRIPGIVADVRNVAKLADPVGEKFDVTTAAGGLKLCKCRIPIGVIGAIYEARPNVTIDIAALCLKTGNGVILRGSSDTLATNRYLVQIIQKTLADHGFPKGCVQFVDSSDRAVVKEMLQLSDYIDLIIPRGGENLHRFCRENSRIPVITGGMGVCHLFADKTCDQTRAIPVILNAKTQRPTVCNALDTVLVHKDIAASFIPQIARELIKAGVTLHADERSSALLQKEGVAFLPYRQGDWDREWLSLDINLVVVDDLKQAIAHIQKHSTQHSDGILTNDPQSAAEFQQKVDSAAVYVNASTRFTDGSQFGLGAEVAISTQRIHARGPLGLKELTSYKWLVEGNYNVRP